MPLKDFKCTRCNTIEERQVPMEHDIQYCNKCGKAMSKEMSVPTLHGFDSFGTSKK